MLKPLIVIAALAVIATPSVALAQGNSDNTPASQNANGIPFTANDPPANTFHGPPSLPPALEARFLLVAAFLQPIKTIVTGKTATTKNWVPAIRIASRRARSVPRQP